jgi:predicted lipoprotein with Yx(FWY)xxD motif
MFRNRTLIAVIVAGTALVAACGGDDDTAAPLAPPPLSAPPGTTAPAGAGSPAAEAETVAVRTGDTALGPVLVGRNGNTLYGFTNDLPTQSNCEGTCAEAWPPVIVEPNWTVAPGVDSGIFNTITRPDGQLQLVAGKWPLYYYSGDSVPGDANGQGSGDVWFAAGTDGALIRKGRANPATPATTAPAAVEAPATTAPADPYAAPAPTSPAPEVGPPAPAATAESPLGTILVDAAGFTLYGFANDVDGHPTCNDSCADAWPPALVDGAELPAGLDPAVFSVVTRDDGTNQLKAGAWPLYRFAGDASAGETNGQGSGGVWFAVDPLGGLIKG